MPRSARLVLAATIVYWCALFLATHLPVPRLPLPPVTDKTMHFLSYALLAVGLFASFTLAGSVRQDLGVIVLAICMVYGALDELLQIPVGRHADRADWFADVAGAATGVVLAWAVNAWMRRRKRET